MASNPNDIQLRINAAVDGLQDIGKLLGELDELGGDTSDASRDVEQLNESMSTLSQQDKLIDALDKTRSKVDDARSAMDDASAQAATLQRAYDDAAAGVDEQRRAAEQAANSAEQASTVYQRQRRELQALQTQYKDVQGATTGARQAWRDAAQRVTDLEAGIAGSADASAAQRRELDQARGAADQARRSYEQQAGSLSDLRDRLTEQRSATEQTKQAWEESRDESRRLNRELKASERAFSQQGKATAKANQAADQARGSFERQANTLDELSSDARAAGINVDNLAGEQARLDSESAQLQGRVDSLKNSLRDYRGELDQTDSRLGGFIQRLKGGIATFSAWSAAAVAGGAALSVGVIARYTAAQARMAEQLDNTSSAIGVNAQRLQEYQYAFGRVGIDADKTASILKDVADKVGDFASTGGGEAADLFENLNISIEELQRLSPDEQLLAIAQALDEVQSRGDKVFFLESIADDASLLLPLLEDNAAGLRKLSDEANSVGAILSPDDVANLKDTNAAVERLQGRLTGLKNSLLGELSPAVSEVADDFDELLSDNPGLVDDLATAFGGLLRGTADWIKYIIANRQQVGDSLQGLIDTAQFLGNAFEAAFRGIQTVAAGVVTVIAGAIAGMISQVDIVTRGLNQLGLVSDETMNRMKAKAQAARETVADLARQTVDYGKQTVQAGKDAIGAYDNTASAAEDSADRQRKAAAQLDQSAIDAATAIGKQANAHQQAAEAAEASARRQQKALEQAREALGLSLDEIVTGISDTEREAIDAFERIVSDGVDTLSKGGLQRAFAGLADSIKSPEAVREIEALLDTLEERGVAVSDEIRKEFTSLANGIKGTSEQIGAEMQAAISNATSDEQLGALTARLLKAWREGKIGVDEYRAALDSLEAKHREVATGAEQAATASKASMENAAQGAKGAGDAAKQSGDDANKATGGWLNYQQVLDKASEGIGVVVRNSAQAMRYTREFNEHILAQARAWKASQVEQERARYGLEDLYEATEGYGNSLQRTGQATQDVAEELQWMSESAGQSVDALLRMDAADLSTIRNQAAQLRGEIDSLNDSLADTVSSLEQQLANMQGNAEQAQALRYREQEAELQQQLARAQELNDQQAIANAREALDLARQINDEKLREIRAQDEQQRQAAAQQAARDAQQAAQAESQQRDQQAFQRTQTDAINRTTRQAAASLDARTVTINLDAFGQRLGTLEGVDESQANALLESIERGQFTAAR